MNLDNMTAKERFQLAAANNGLGIIKHLNGTISTDASALDIQQPAVTAIIINNTHAANTLSVSFDETNYFDISAGNSMTIEDVAIFSLYVKGSGAGTTYQILYY